METKVILCKLVAKETDAMDYTTYVFEVDQSDPFWKYSKYCMCVRYPNWEHKSVILNQEGYLHFIEVIAGKDKYWDGQQFIPYNYTNWQFVKFIEKPQDNISSEIIID